MTMPWRPSRSTASSEPRRPNRTLAKPLLTAIGLGLFGFALVALSGAQPAKAADPTTAPFVEGHHVYDNGDVLSSHSFVNAEALATHIQAQGGGRVSGKPGEMYATAVGCFILAIPNRYLPILQEGKIESLRDKYRGQ